MWLLSHGFHLVLLDLNLNSIHKDAIEIGIINFLILKKFFFKKEQILSTDLNPV